MFKCQKTGKVVGPGVAAIKVVVETRKKHYVNYHPETKDRIDSDGYETIREIMVSPEGYKQMLANGEVNE